ncbi:MAG: recombinase zinc beta ribbon domain-containing protein, partial [Chloroflexi bacterium]|nr:recombinase zinc beta ribbon domain-containing protein [Chloroflexota bacterium]
RKLTQEGIPIGRKYHPKGQRDAKYIIGKSGRWWSSNISRIIRSETYKGTHFWDAKDKNIARPVPELVDAVTWERANRQLTKNKLYPNRGKNNRYLLRGLIRCADCGKTYGGFMASGKGSNRLYYRCGSQGGESATGLTCNGKLIPAKWLESQVWDDINAFVMNPGDVVHKLKERMEAELTTVSKGETRKRELEKAINLKEGEKARTLDLYKWGLLTVEDLDKYVQQHRRDLEPLQAEMANLLNQGAEQGQKVGKLTDSESLLKALQDRIKGPVDWDTKRRVIELLVWSISVKTKGMRRKKQASVEIVYAFEPKPIAVVNGIG